MCQCLQLSPREELCAYIHINNNTDLSSKVHVGSYKVFYVLHTELATCVLNWFRFSSMLVSTSFPLKAIGHQMCHCGQLPLFCSLHRLQLCINNVEVYLLLCKFPFIV